MSTEISNNHASSPLPITDLDPANPPPSNRHIRAVVTLLWPYSSSTRSCALLLGDPDFRLRLRRGQVRVRLHGPSARIVAERQVGIGDTVELALTGARWVEEDVLVASGTPGKSVEAELDYVEKLNLRVWGDGGAMKDIAVNEQDDNVRGRNPVLETPERGRGKSDWMAEFYGAVPIYSSPAFMRRARLSAGRKELADGFDPFDAWEKDEERPRKKPRFSLDGVKSWRYAERSPSPDLVVAENHEPVVQGAISQEETRAEEPEPDTQQSAKTALDLVDTIQGVFQEAIAKHPSNTSEAHRDLTVSSEPQQDERSQGMQPPRLPFLQMPTGPPMAAIHFENSYNDRPSTPKLQPIASENLPLPSPFPNDASHLQLGASQSSSGPHVGNIEAGHSTALAITSTLVDLIQQPMHNTQVPPQDVVSGEGGLESGQHILTGTRDHVSQSSGHVHLSQEKDAIDEDSRTRENSEDALSLKLPYIQGLSDTEEDDGEMYTKRFPQNLFDPHQGVDDATEDEDDDESGSATPTGNNGSHQALQPTNEQHMPSLSTQQSDRQTSLSPLLESPAVIAIGTSHEPQTPNRETTRVENLVETTGNDRAVARPTPQSEKDRIMNETYRSLFGWQTSPIRNNQTEQPTSTLQTYADADAYQPNSTIIDDGQQYLFSSTGYDVGSTNRSDQHDNIVQGTIPNVYNVASVDFDARIQNPTDNIVFQPSEALTQNETIAHQVYDFDEVDGNIDNAVDNDLTEAVQDRTDASTGLQAMHVPDVFSAPTAVEQPSTLQTDQEDGALEASKAVPQETTSFPSTTVVATDYMSSTEQASFEQFLNQSMTAVDRLDASLIGSFDYQADGGVQPFQYINPHAEIENIDEQVFVPSVADDIMPLNENEISDDIVELSDQTHGHVTQQEPNQNEAMHLGSEERDAKQIEISSAHPHHGMEHVVSADLRIEVPPSLTEQTIRAPVRPASTIYDDGTSCHEQNVATVEAESLTDDVKTQPSPYLAERLPAEPDKPLRQQPPAPPSQPRARASVSPPHATSPSHVQHENEILGNLKSPMSILTQGISLVEETPHSVKSEDPQTPISKISRERDALKLQGSPDDASAKSSPLESPLRRSTRKQNHDEPSLQLTNNNDPLQSNNTPVRRSTRKTENLNVPEIDLPATPSVKATNTRKSSRLQAQSDSQSVSTSPITESKNVSKKATQTRASSKMPSKELDEDIADNVTVASDLDRGTTENNKLPSQSDDRAAGVSKRGKKSHDREEIQPPSESLGMKVSTASPSKKSRKLQDHVESTPAVSQKGADRVASNRKQKVSARRSLPNKSTAVPEAISHWFSPRRSTRLHDEVAPMKNGATEEMDVTPEITKKASATEEKVDNQTQPTSGILTSLSYYMPLSNINEKLNMPAQSGGSSNIDILAVVSAETKVPERAKTGPKDYYTVFHVTDPSMPEAASVLVEIFRSWHATLPVAQVGDVVLLRACTVKSRKRQAYLKSTEASSWCVWRFSEGGDDRVVRDGSPRASRRLSVHSTREDVKGPPVELGEGERQNAQRLRNWWKDEINR